MRDGNGSWRAEVRQWIQTPGARVHLMGVGGIGMAPGANLSDTHAIFEATHGTAPDIAGQGKANPSSLILSAVMMLEHLGWKEAAEAIVEAMNDAIAAGEVTGDLAALRGDVPALPTSAFTAALIRRF